MFGSRRPGKRSIVGTKVCALFEDGFYRPGVIQSVHISPNTPPFQSYSVMFDEGGLGIFRDIQLIGPGFQGLNKGNLKIGQTVFITYNNREVKGRIIGNKEAEINGCATLKYWLVGIGEDNESVVKVKLDDIRLLESRKSARLSDQDTDYVKLADIPPGESKKRTGFIDVPNLAVKQCKSFHNKREDFNITRDIEMEVMDENMAAMVLTSLSCSPVSPLPSNHPSEIVCQNPENSSNVNNDCHVASYSGSSSPTDSNLSQSAPATIFTFSHDENNFSQLGFSRRTVYQCTWPGCKQIYNTCPGIEKHIRMEHLGLENASEHEEEFYYSEIEVIMDSHHNDLPLSPTLNHNFFTPNTDHNYQRKDSNNMPMVVSDRNTQAAIREIILSRSLPWQMPEQGFSFTEQPSGGVPIINGSAKNLVQKKTRAEVKKCRKVYGLENRASWCTQCKWKKACTRFQERPFDIVS